MTNPDGTLSAYPQHAAQMPPVYAQPVATATTQAPQSVWNAPVAAPAPVVPQSRIAAYRDTLGWSLVKHAALLGVVAAVVSFVFEAGRSPVLSLAYAATSLVFLGIVALLDRQRFEDAGRTYERAHVQVPGYARTWTVPAQPAAWQVPANVTPQLAPQQLIAPEQRLAPLGYELAAALTTRVDVT